MNYKDAGNKDVFVKIPELYYKSYRTAHYFSRKRRKKGKKYVYFFKGLYFMDNIAISKFSRDGYKKSESFLVGRYPFGKN